MRGFAFRLTTVALLACIPQFGFAQEAAQAEEKEGKDLVCLAIGRRWAGSTDDLRQIHEKPVPESFSRTYEGGGCAAWQLFPDSLVDWHLAFGDETTTTAALAYLERRVTAGKPFRSSLSAAAKRDFDLANGYRFIAMEYARAADFFSSPTLVAKAQRFGEPSLAVALQLRTPRDRPEPCEANDMKCLAAPKPPELPAFDDYLDRLWRELDLQLAVASARIGGKDADLDSARAVFARNDDPNFEEAGRYAYTNGEDFCDIGDATYLTEWQKACREGNFARLAESYWRYRAIFSLSAQAAAVEGLGKHRDEWDGDTALRLIEGRQRDESDGMPGLRFGSATHAVTDIRLAMAEAQFAKAKRAFASDPRPGRTQAAEDASHALDLLWQAATYVQGADHPGWMRRIGRRYLEMSKFAEEVRDPEDPILPSHARRLAWFRTILPRLDTIARGDVAP